METTQSQKEDIQVLQLLLQKSVLFKKLLRTKLLFLGKTKIVAISPLEEDKLLSPSYTAKGYIKIEGKVFPLSLYYGTVIRQLTVYIGKIKVEFSINEIEKLIHEEVQRSFYEEKEEEEGEEDW